MKRFMTPKMQGQLRHFLTSMGGVAVAKGVIDAETMIAVVGAVMAALGFGWSWFSPEKK
jgi:hypothetical protein